MKNTQPVHIIHYYFKRLNIYAQQLKKGFDEETIHLFRVDVKKLRAFLRMMRSGHNSPEVLKFPQKFKKMYSLTGKIRDRQLCLKRIKEYEDTRGNRLRSKIFRLEEEIKQLAENENEILTKKEFSEIEQKMIKELTCVPKDALIKNFISQKLNDINQVISKGDYKDNKLHSIRKSIKDIIYLAMIFRDESKRPLPFLFRDKTGLEKAERLSHHLGLFNDTSIALSFFKPAGIKKGDTEEAKYLNVMRRKWLEEKRKMKKKILDEVKEINCNFSKLSVPRFYRDLYQFEHDYYYSIKSASNK